MSISGPPPENSAGSDAQANPPGGPRHAAPKKRRRFWPSKRWVQIVLSLCLVLALIVIAGSGYLYWESTRVNRINVQNLTNAPSTGQAAGTENILLVGSTSRCALTVQNPAYGLCSQGVTGVNSDVIMILHLDWTTSKVTILSIPRDTFIPNARSSGAQKIDAALAEGPSQLVKAIEQDFAIPIQHYVELNFQTFAEVVDALGGVSMYFPTPVYDAYSGLRQLTTGCVHLTGIEALQVVRARHLQYQTATSGTNPANWPQESLSDLARIRRDHEFLKVLGASVKAQGLSNPITDTKIISSVAPNLTVDSGFSTSHMASMVLHFQNVDIGSVPELTLPVMTSTSYSYIYKGSDYGNVTFPVNYADNATILAFLHESLYTNTMTGKPLPKWQVTTVSIQNGSGKSGDGQIAASQLQYLGFHIGSVEDTTPVGNPAETVITYNSLNPDVVAQAQNAERVISGQSILAYDPTMTAPVTVVLGTNWYIPLATPSPTTTTAPVTSTTTKAKGHPTSTTTPPTTTTIPPVPGFAAPNPAVTTLQPWDPRSCTASGGKGK